MAQSCDTGTVVTFEVWLGPKHNSASIIFNARVVATGIRVTPKNIEQITSMSVLPLHQWVNLFNTMRDLPAYGEGHLRAFTIPWKLYTTIISDPEAWLRDVLERKHDEYEEECRNG